MKRKVRTQLLLMGLLSALLVSVLLAFAFLNGYYRQIERDLRAYADLILSGADDIGDAASFGIYAAEDRRITRYFRRGRSAVRQRCAGRAA